MGEVRKVWVVEIEDFDDITECHECAFYQESQYRMMSPKCEISGELISWDGKDENCPIRQVEIVEKSY